MPAGSLFQRLSVKTQIGTSSRLLKTTPRLSCGFSILIWSNPDFERRTVLNSVIYSKSRAPFLIDIGIRNAKIHGWCPHVTDICTENRYGSYGSIIEATNHGVHRWGKVISSSAIENESIRTTRLRDPCTDTKARIRQLSTTSCEQTISTAPIENH